MQSEWLAVEHHRIHLMEQWPDGPRKEAGLNSARSTLNSLLLSIPSSDSFACALCSSKSQCTTLVSSKGNTNRKKGERRFAAERNGLAAA